MAARGGRFGRRQAVDPGEDQRDREGDEQQYQDERSRPLRQPQHRGQIADELDQYPRNDGVNSGHTIDVAAFNIRDESTEPPAHRGVACTKVPGGDSSRAPRRSPSTAGISSPSTQVCARDRSSARSVDLGIRDEGWATRCTDASPARTPARAPARRDREPGGPLSAALPASQKAKNRTAR